MYSKEEGDDALDQVRGKIFRGPGQIPLLSNFLQTWSGAGPGQVVSGPGQVRSKLLVVGGSLGQVFKPVPGMVLCKILKNPGKTDLQQMVEGLLLSLVVH